MKRAPVLWIASVLAMAPSVTFAQLAPPPLLPPSPPFETPRPSITPRAPASVGSQPSSMAVAPVTPPPEPLIQSAPKPPEAPAPAKVPSAAPVELTSLGLMRDKGIISKAEYESAIHQLSETAGLRASKEATVVVGKWATTLYGFVEADAIWDSTRTFFDLAGNSGVARSGTQAGDNARYQMGIRNSRLGIRMKAPEVGDGVRASAMLEVDFLGLPTNIAAPAFGGSLGGGITEGQFMASPVLRVRHVNLKVETPIVDVLFGQYWQLFGWPAQYTPNTVEIQGVPGELFGRTSQLRVSKTIKAYPVTIELALAAVRPVQRDTAMPDGQAGIRLALDPWTGVQTLGSTGTQISPLSVAVTGLVRQVHVDSYVSKPAGTDHLTMSAVAVDGFVPVLPGTKAEMGNSLSLNGELTTGYGDGDEFTGLNGGIGFPTYPPLATGPTTAAANIDNGIVTYDSAGALHGIQWTTYLLGAQYYLPGLAGKLWISGNYSHIESNNIDHYATTSTPKSKLTKAEDWFDVNVFGDPTPAVRVGLEYANFNTMYSDGIRAISHRFQLSVFYLF